MFIAGADAMPKLKVIDAQPSGKIYVFECPACKYGHPFHVGVPGSPSWEFNGSLDKPTFSPSLLVNQHDPSRLCHSFVRDGNIQFLADSWHKRSDTVPLPEAED
jgi:hypothetical protein